MPDHREELAGNNLHISSHTRHESEGDREFCFWSSSNTTSIENGCDQLEGGNEAKFNNCEAEFAKGFGVHSPLLCEKYKALLPCSHHHRCSVSDSPRTKAIEEGRRHLMGMIQDLPESSFELSFQDMVVVEQDQHKNSVDNTRINSENEAQSKKLNKKKKKKKKKKKDRSNRQGQILRVESMDSETFLLKMFFPTSLDWAKKLKVYNGSKSKVSPRTSFQESITQVGKEWRIKRFFLSSDNKSDTEHGIGPNTSRITSEKSGYFSHIFPFSLGCWPFFHCTKSKNKETGKMHC